MSWLTFALKHWRAIGAGVVFVSLATALKVQSVKHELAIARETKSARRVADSTARVRFAESTQRIYDSTTKQLAYAELMWKAAKANSDEQLRRANIRIRSDAATDSLYASLARLSDSAKADTTVQAVVATSKALADSNKVLQGTVESLGHSLLTERAAAESVHTSDTLLIRSLSRAVVVTRDSLQREQERPKRTLKSTMASVLSGVGIDEAVRITIKLLRRGNP